MGLEDRSDKTVSHDGLVKCPIKGWCSISYHNCAKLYDPDKCAENNCTHHITALKIAEQKKENGNGRSRPRRRAKKPGKVPDKG